MAGILPFKKRLSKQQDNKIHLGVFDREGFLNNIGYQIYEGLTSEDYKGMYERAYKVFVHNQGHPFKIEPEPPSPQEIKGKFTLETLFAIEPLLSIQYGAGLNFVCKIFGKKPDKEIEDMFDKVK